MAIKGCGGVVKLGANAIAEIVDWTLDQAASEEDISIINNNCDARTDAGITTHTITLNGFLDPTDSTGQGAMEVGTSGLALTLYPSGDAVGSPTREATGGVVTAYNETGGASGHVRFTSTIKANLGVAFGVAA